MQELKALPIWFPWRKEIDGDHIKKLPFAAGGGATGTNDKYRHTWVIYGEAVAAAEKVGFSIGAPVTYTAEEITENN